MTAGAAEVASVLPDLTRPPSGRGLRVQAQVRQDLLDHRPPALALRHGQLDCEQLLALSPRPTRVVTRHAAAGPSLQPRASGAGWRLYEVRSEAP